MVPKESSIIKRPFLRLTALLAALCCTAQAAALPDAQEQAQIYRAAGFEKMHGKWKGGCKDQWSVHISLYRDINRDGTPEAMVAEVCGNIDYGNTGQAFTLLSKRSGSWEVLAQAIAMPDLLDTRGSDNMPDIELGGPGFCFPVLRFNGSEYRYHRSEYEGKPCKGYDSVSDDDVILD